MTKKLAKVIGQGIEWQLMDKMSLPVFWTSMSVLSTGKGKNKKDVGELGVAMNGAALYLFTRQPHPDDKKCHATYVLPLSDMVKDIMGKVMS